MQQGTIASEFILELMCLTTCKIEEQNPNCRLTPSLHVTWIEEEKKNGPIEFLHLIDRNPNRVQNSSGESRLPLVHQLPSIIRIPKTQTRHDEQL
jgi:hypothetical protein